jgi:5-methylcytosine-specific restriction endonuclease McrA
MASNPAAREKPENGAVPCLSNLPYRMIAFVRIHPNGTPLYQVAGSAAGPRGAERALRLAHETHGGKCFYCDKKLDCHEVTVDHVQPAATGGTKHIQNLVIACKPCNTSKGAQAIEIFKPAAGREWLSAMLVQVQERLNRLP